METPSSGTATPRDVENEVGPIRKRLTLTFRDLSVQVTAPNAALGSTLWSDVDPRQLASLFTQKKQPKRVLSPRRHGSIPVLTRTDYSEGCFGPSEARGNGLSYHERSWSMANQDSFLFSVDQGPAAPRFSVFSPTTGKHSTKSAARFDMVVWTIMRPGTSDSRSCSTMKVRFYSFMTATC